MSRLKLLFFIIVTPCALFAQNPFSRKADSLYRAKQYLPAASLYSRSATLEAFKVMKASNYYNAACSYSLGANADSAIWALDLAVANGYKNVEHLKTDTDLNTLHGTEVWTKLVKNLEALPAASTSDPAKAKLITSDITLFWKAYDLVQKDTANRTNIYKKEYLDKGSDGLQDYFAYKVRSLRSFVLIHDQKPRFYAAIRKNTLAVEKQKPGIIKSFKKFKDLYPAASFPNTYFVMGAFSSGGTSTSSGLLIGLDQSAKTPEIPLDELSLWQKNNFNDLVGIPGLIAHELIHFNQKDMQSDTTLLKGVLIEGMADFIGELISGKNSNERLHIWAKGKEKSIMNDFKKEMWLNRSRNWIANSDQETADKPADLGYWVGYQICKAYYNQSPDKQKAINDLLNVKDYKAIYLQSGADQLFN
jgi:hypothetical protein